MTSKPSTRIALVGPPLAGKYTLLSTIFEKGRLAGWPPLAYRDVALEGVQHHTMSLDCPDAAEGRVVRFMTSSGSLFFWAECMALHLREATAVWYVEMGTGSAEGLTKSFREVMAQAEEIEKAPTQIPWLLIQNRPYGEEKPFESLDKNTHFLEGNAPLSVVDVRKDGQTFIERQLEFFFQNQSFLGNR